MSVFNPARALWAFSLVALCLSPVAHAELGFFEKIKAKREAERLAAANQPVLTQAEVDRLAATIPLVQSTLEQLDLPELSEEQSKKMSIASLSGNPTVTMASLLEGTEARATLDQQAKKSGYDGFDHYARHFDVAYGVINAGNWILMARNIVKPGEEKPEPIDDLWAFIEDETKPAAEREKLSTQLDEMLPKFGTNRQNAEIIYRNMATLKPLVSLDL